MTVGAPALAQGLAEVFALELEEQLRAALALWPRARLAASRAAVCRDLSRAFHTIKGGAGLAGRAELAASALLLERFFADPAACSAPPQAALDTLFAAAGLDAPRLDGVSRALAAGEPVIGSAEPLIPIAVGESWLAIRLHAVRRASCITAELALRGAGEGAGERMYLADLLAVPRSAGRGVALALHGGATLVVDRVRPPLTLAVTALHRVLALHPWLSGTTIDADGRPICVLEPSRLQSHMVPDATSPAPHVAQRASLAAVLVVDDSLVAREVASATLRAAGIGVDLARDGREALSKLQRAAYSVVLSDLEMPQLDGFDLIARLRASESLRSQPVVVCSSRLDADARRRLDPLDVAGFVAKPFAADELLGALQPWLKP